MGWRTMCRQLVGLRVLRSGLCVRKLRNKSGATGPPAQPSFFVSEQGSIHHATYLSWLSLVAWLCVAWPLVAADTPLVVELRQAPFRTRR